MSAQAQTIAMKYAPVTVRECAVMAAAITAITWLVRVSLSSKLSIPSSSATFPPLSKSRGGSSGRAGHNMDVPVANTMQCDDVTLNDMLTPNAQLWPR